MKFTKESLMERLEDDAFEENKIVGKSRWANEHRMVFEHEGHFYAARYRQGTGDEGEEPFQGLRDSEEIECLEVFPTQRTITVYVEAKA